MSDGFNPDQFAASTPGRLDPDADWMQVAEKLPAASCHARKKQDPYIPAIPRKFLRLARPAGDALELLLVALAEMRMRGTRELAIGPTLWAQVGNPSKRVRARLLRQIMALPESLCTITPRNGRPHLLTAGLEWPQNSIKSRTLPRRVETA
jgi:hypothetical protein